MLTPVFSYFATAASLGLPFTEVKRVLATFSKLSLGLNAMGFILGLGILGVKRWGYFLFLVFNFILVGHGIHLLYKFGFVEQFLWNMLYTVVPFILISYFLTKEISTPYLTLIPRGFRNKWRTEIPIGGQIILTTGESLRMVTMDISPTGCLARVDGIVPENSSVKINLDLDGQNWEAPALWVREEDGNQGFKFLISSLSQERESLDKFLSTKLLPRYTTTRGIEIEYNSVKFHADVINISEKGLYISTYEKLSLGEHFSFKMKLKGFTFTGIAKVSWENSEAKFDKPAGFGAAFVTMSSSFLYSIILSVYEMINNFSKRER